MFGSPETTPGGRALKFYSSVRLDIRRIESIKDGVEVVGNRTRVKVVKNKVAPPFKQAEFDIMYGKGISREGSLLDIGVDLGIVKKSGAWYTYDGEQLGQGRENAKQFLIDNPEVMVEVSERIRTELGIGTAKVVDDTMSPADDAPITLDCLTSTFCGAAHDGRPRGRVPAARRPPAHARLPSFPLRLSLPGRSATGRLCTVTNVHAPAGGALMSLGNNAGSAVVSDARATTSERPPAGDTRMRGVGPVGGPRRGHPRGPAGAVPGARRRSSSGGSSSAG